MLGINQLRSRVSQKGCFSRVARSPFIMSTARPALRGLLKSQLKRDFLIACGVSVVACAAWRYGHQMRVRGKYEEYYKNLDTKVEFDRMVKAGVFTSVNTDGSVNTEGW